MERVELDHYPLEVIWLETDGNMSLIGSHQGNEEKKELNYFRVQKIVGKYTESRIQQKRV